MSFIEMDHIRKSFGNLEVIKDVSLHVETGEVVSIIGPSGSGKSTFLRCLCQLETINSGSIVVDGKTMASTPAGSQRAVYAPAATFGLSVAAWACAFSTSTCFRI